MFMPSKREFQFGWLPDLPDHRDLLYASVKKIKRKLPDSVDLRKQCPVVYDQGSLGSCTANALGAAFQFGQMKQAITDFIPSRLFIYYNERVQINTILSDSGAFIRDGIKSLNRDGVCPELDWPYLIAKFTQKPPSQLYKKALKHQVIQYMRLENWQVNQLKTCLSEGFPFVFGFSVFESFNSIGKNALIPMPKKGERMIRGHAVMAVGYDNVKRRFLIRNSWGEAWGNKGHAWMPFDYITHTSYADDFWTIRLVEDGMV
ncbi:MAG: peptidase C1 [Sphingobacteriia bacterium 39-39-8]|nr:MAG: peptidase C1 [Sphingobacteriia bacterium 39-39-8]